MRDARTVLLAAFLAILAWDHRAFTQSATAETALESQYRRAVEATANDPTNMPLTQPLTVITSSDNLVQMTVFTNWAGYDRNYDEFANPGSTRHPSMFSTYGTQLYDFHKTNNTPGNQMCLRTEQLLGLPPNYGNDRVVEFEIQSKYLFRPAYDSNIEHATPTNVYNPGDPHADWFNHHWNAWNAQTHAFQYSDVHAYPPAYDYSTYSDSNGAVHTNVPYPWTRVGYTYDWANVDSTDPNAIIGLSEFITPAKSVGQTINQIKVQAVVSIGSYSYYDRATGNFDVTGDCDTIWAGTRYTPVTPAAGETPWVHVAQGATVSQGITVSSEGFEIVNYGSILGPGKNLDRDAARQRH